MPAVSPVSVARAGLVDVSDEPPHARQLRFQLAKRMQTKGDAERARELAELADALSELASVLQGEIDMDFSEALPWLREYHERVTACAARRPFEQSELNELSRDVPKLIDLHPHWVPPLNRRDDGSFTVSNWYTRLKPVHDRVQRVAFELRVTGEY